MPLAATDTGILIWWGVWCTNVAGWFPVAELTPGCAETTRTWGREPAAKWLTIRAACWDVTGCEADGQAWLVGKIVPSWGSEGGDTSRTLGQQKEKQHTREHSILNTSMYYVKKKILSHTNPELFFIVSGTPVFVGVVAVQGKGDLGVPGVVGVGVVGIGDMGLEPTSCPASRDPGVLLPPSLLPDF